MCFTQISLFGRVTEFLFMGRAINLPFKNYFLKFFWKTNEKKNFTSTWFVLISFEFELATDNIRIEFESTSLQGSVVQYRKLGW